MIKNGFEEFLELIFSFLFGDSLLVDHILTERSRRAGGNTHRFHEILDLLQRFFTMRGIVTSQDLLKNMWT